MPRRGTRTARGFTLIELLVVVAIVAILTAAAIEGYGFAMVKSRRGAAKGCLAEGAQYLERYYTTHFQYTGATLPTCSADVTGFYTVGFVGTPDASTYAIQAVPQGAQARGDTLCGTLSLNQVGNRTASGTGGVAACW
jgi:type IV pilus assembly protein PilE